MDNREKKTAITPSGHKVEMYTYSTGREAREIEGAYLKNCKMEMVAGSPTLKEIDLSAQSTAEDAMIKLLVVSVNGSNDNILDKVLDMEKVDYDAIIKELNEVTKKK